MQPTIIDSARSFAEGGLLVLTLPFNLYLSDVEGVARHKRLDSARLCPRVLIDKSSFASVLENGFN